MHISSNKHCKYINAFLKNWTKYVLHGGSYLDSVLVSPAVSNNPVFSPLSSLNSINHLILS